MCPGAAARPRGGHRLCRSAATTLRERLLNVAVGIERFVRRIVLYFRATFRVAADLVGHRVRPGRHPVAE